MITRPLTALLLSMILVLAACSDDDGVPPPRDGAPDSFADPDAVTGADGGQCSAVPVLPGNGEVGDFTQPGPQVASTNGELTDLINGGSEKFTQGGKFVCMALTTYTSTTKSHELEVWVFDLTDAAGAEAAYAATANPDDTDLTPVIGDAARGHANSIAGIYQADMRKGRYLARVMASDLAGEADVVAMLTQIADGIQ